jgi:hypothetical protein
MKYFVHHRRGECSSYYSKLIPKNYNNTNCIVLSAKNKGELKKGDKTFNDKTWLENSCDLQGINHVSLTMDTIAEETAYVAKIKYFYDYLLNCDYEYVMVSDSTDCVILKNPDDAISLLDEYKCDILYGVGTCNNWESFTMPERASFNKTIYGDIKLNSGVCIGKVDTLIKLYERVLYYADDTLPARDYWLQYTANNGFKNWSTEKLNQFPMGVAGDQLIIKYLIKEFHPHLKLDVNGLLTNKR